MAKKIIFILFAFLILPSAVNAQTLYEEQTTTDSRASRDKLGQIFTGSNSYTPTSIHLLLFQDGGTVSSYTTKIYTYGGGDPDSGTEICTGTDSSPSLPSYPDASVEKELALTCSDIIETGLDYSFVITSNLTDGIGSDVGNSLTGSFYKFSSGAWGDGSSALYYQIYGDPETPPASDPNPATSTPDVVALGSIILALGIIIVLMMLGFTGYIFNRISSKKPWK